MSKFLGHTTFVSATHRCASIAHQTVGRRSLISFNSSVFQPIFFPRHHTIMATAKPKLHGRAFYESIGSPKYIVAPMVDQSEFAWRLLTRSFLPSESRSSVLAYSPMLHAKLFCEAPKYRETHFEPLKPPLTIPATEEKDGADSVIQPENSYLDGNAQAGDRPLFVQFCANAPEAFLEAAKIVQPFCDAVDLNLGCPQGIARRGAYGAFLQEHPDTIYKLINTLHKELDIPVTAKFRIRETKEKTLEYAKMIVDAGASIITVHGRLREQKGHNTGLADWRMIRYLRDNLPPETVIFANGNILQHEDLKTCLEETKADGIMSAEGNLYDPSIFAEPPPVGQEGREYFRGVDGKGGYRMDAVLQRYLDIIHTHVLRQDPPQRQPLFIPSDLTAQQRSSELAKQAEVVSEDKDDAPPAKRQKTDHQPTLSKKESKKEMKRNKKNEDKAKRSNEGSESKRPEKVTKVNLIAMQSHCFHLLRPLVAKHHNVRDALARCRAGDIDAYEHVLTLTIAAVRRGLLEYDADPLAFEAQDAAYLNTVASWSGNNKNHKSGDSSQATVDELKADESSYEAVRRCKRPWFVCQPYVRPLPREAFEKGSMQLSKKQLAEREEEQLKLKKQEQVKKEEALPSEEKAQASAQKRSAEEESHYIPPEGVVCG